MKEALKKIILKRIDNEEVAEELSIEVYRFLSRVTYCQAYAAGQEDLMKEIKAYTTLKYKEAEKNARLLENDIKT